MWYKEKNIKGANLIEEALDLLGAEELQAIVGAQVNARTDTALNRLNPTEQLQDMAIMAQRMAEDGIMESPTQAFLALQARARANAILQVADNPKYQATQNAYLQRRSETQALLAKQNAEMQAAKEAGESVSEIVKKYKKQIQDAEAAEAKALDDFHTQIRDNRDGLGFDGDAAKTWGEAPDLRGDFRQAANMEELAGRIARKELGEEMALVYRTFDENPEVAAAAMKELAEKAAAEEMPFFGRATAALNRTVFNVPNNARIDMQATQTGLPANQRTLLPIEADGIFSRRYMIGDQELLLLKHFMQHLKQAKLNVV